MIRLAGNLKIESKTQREKSRTKPIMGSGKLSFPQKGTPRRTPAGFLFDAES